MRLPLLLIALVPVPLHVAASAAPIAQGIVQPATYRSPSGAFELFIDPTERWGAGAASYRLSRDGVRSWEREFPFTLVDGGVLDDGTVAGYAYTEPWRAGGELVLAILAPDGSPRRVERVARNYPLREHGSIEPWVGRFRLSSRDDQFVLELLHGNRVTGCRTFRFSTGEELPESLTMPEMREELAALKKKPDVLAPAPLRGLELVPLGQVRFDGFYSGDRLTAPHRRFVDPRGRICISEMGSGVVRVFDSAGKALFVCTPRPDDVGQYRPYHWLGVRADGHLFGLAHERLVEFDEQGARVACRPSAQELDPLWLFQPSGGGHWEVDYFGELLGSDGERAPRVERGARHRWFRYLSSAAVAPDGTLAVLDEPGDWAQDDDPARLVQLVSPSGTPLGMIPVPEECAGDALAFDGQDLALLARRELWVLSSSTAYTGRASLPEDWVEPRDVFFSPDGKELWIFTRPEPVMHRLALRWE